MTRPIVKGKRNRVELLLQLVVDVISGDTGNHTDDKRGQYTRHFQHLLSNWIDAVEERICIDAIIAQRREVDKKLTNLD